MRSIRLLASALMLAIPTAGLHAQAPKAAPAEAQKLALFSGRWTSEGTMAGMAGQAGGRTRGSESCELMPGGFQVMCRGESVGPQGTTKMTGIIAWDVNNRRYVYQGFDDAGNWSEAIGKFDQGAFVWTGESRIGTQGFQSRHTVTEPRDGSYTYKWETSSDRGGTWITFASGTESRVP